MATAPKNKAIQPQQASNDRWFRSLMDRALLETKNLPISTSQDLSESSEALVKAVPEEVKTDIDADYDILLARPEGILERDINASLSEVLHALPIGNARAFATDLSKYQAMVNQEDGRDTAFDHKLFTYWATRESVLAAYRKAGRNIREMVLYKLLVENNYGAYGGTPILVAEFDETLNGTPADLELLDVLGQIGQAGHFVWTVNVGPNFFGVETWEELPTSKKKLEELAQSKAMSAFGQFRLKPWARYVNLCMPGLYGTAPFDPEGNPADDLPDFKEVIVTEDGLVVNSAAAAMTYCITRSMKETDWPVNIVGETFGGKIEGLVVMKLGEDTREERYNATTQLPIPDSIELVLIDHFGVTPRLAKQDSNIATVFGAATTARAVRGLDPTANADAEMLTRLPNVLVACRFAHFLKALHRGLIGCGKSASEVEIFMQTWANQWVLNNPEGASEGAKAERPFRKVIVDVQKVPEKPGYLDATVTFIPHYRVTAIKTKIVIMADPPEDKPAS